MTAEQLVHSAEMIWCEVQLGTIAAASGWCVVGMLLKDAAIERRGKLDQGIKLVIAWVQDFWSADIGFGEALLRLSVAMGLSALIGFEREATGRAAGLRTPMLVGLAAALFTIIAFEMFT